jgi:DsbC/DsbD-like thiol-disulfide interchange protein
MRLLATSTLALLLAASPFAQSGNSAGADSRTVDTPHLKLTTSTRASTDGTIALLLDVVPKPRMHVYAPGQDGYIVVTLTLTPDPGVKVSAPQFPAPEKLFLEAVHETQLVYSKPFRIVQRITLAHTSRTAIKGTLRYQACDDKVCYLPKTVALEWSVGGKKKV